MQPTDAAKNLQQRYDDALMDRKRSGLLRELPSSSKAGIDFTHNDYLGLSRHRAVIQAAVDAAEKFGTGGRASRLLGAEAELIRALECDIVAAKSSASDAAALVFPSGYQLNSGVLATLLNKSLLGEEPVVFSDRLIHASLHHGITLAGVRQHRFSHNDPEHLERLLKKHNGHGPRVVIIESVYSMDGDIACLDEIYELKSRYGFQLYIDEAHATGVIGERGYGLAKHAEGQGDFVVGTFSKAIGASGGYIVADSTSIKLLVNYCSSFIYTTAPSPMVIAAAKAAWGLLPELDAERELLMTTANDFRDRLHDSGFDTGKSATNIVPVMMPDVERARDKQKALADKELYVSLIRPPTVPPDGTRLRIGICSTHSASDIAGLTKALCQ